MNSQFFFSRSPAQETPGLRLEMVLGPVAAQLEIDCLSLIARWTLVGDFGGVGG